MVCEQLIENLVEKPKPPIRQPKPETLNLAINCNPSRFVETAVAGRHSGPCHLCTRDRYPRQLQGFPVLGFAGWV